jgi:hypothetical protein
VLVEPAAPVEPRRRERQVQHGRLESLGQALQPHHRRPTGTPQHVRVCVFNNELTRVRHLSLALSSLSLSLCVQDPTTGNTFLGFEDVVLGGDQDYNDVILYLTWNCTVDESRLPCYNSCRYASQVPPLPTLSAVLGCVELRLTHMCLWPLRCLTLRRADAPVPTLQRLLPVRAPMSRGTTPRAPACPFLRVRSRVPLP